MSSQGKRLHVFYSGRVQGVGFRFTVERIALDLGLKGWVKNLADGRVEMLCEGNPASLQKCLTKIDDAFSRYIGDKQVKQMPATGEFANFAIRFF